MIEVCPHCSQENTIAGHYRRACRQGQRTEGKDVVVIYCGWCGKTFTPQEPAAVESVRVTTIRMATP